jgi:leucyl aminopeptidase
VTTFEISSTSPAKTAADLLIMPVFQGPVAGPGLDEVQRAMDADLLAMLEDGGLKGKLGDAFAAPTFGRIKARVVLLVGMGPEDEADSLTVRRAAQRMASRAAKYVTVASTLPQVGPSPESSAQAFVEGMVLGAYRFTRYKERPIDDASQEKVSLKKVVGLSDDDPKPLRAAMRRGQVYGEAANWARDLVNTPALDATPIFLAQEARKMAALNGLECRIWTKADLKKGGFGGILGVGSGSVNEPRMIELSYKGAGNARPIAITGKGVTFDSGGLSLKESQGMEWMKADMSGAAATMAVMRAMALLKPKVNVIAAIPSAENMPGGSAIRPGDVLRHRGGKTSEVLNTDAEGRLILADALAYLSEKRPVAIIDSATLTGAAVVALGEDIWAVMGSDGQLIEDLRAAGDEVGEPGWELPLWKEYRKHIESTVADVKNIGNRWGGAITAALFLKEFVDDIPWAHIDVAGPAYSERATDYWPKGATGSPTRTILRYIERQAEKNGPRRRR